MAKSLKKLLGDSDGTVRWKATEVLFICSNHAIGRDSILEFGLIQPISALFDDKHDDARLMSHRFAKFCFKTFLPVSNLSLYTQFFYYKKPSIRNLS